MSADKSALFCFGHMIYKSRRMMNKHHSAALYLLYAYLPLCAMALCSISLKLSHPSKSSRVRCIRYRQ